MSSEMVERVARAMMALHYTYDTYDRPASIKTREIYLEDASAAIAAMREPTEGMKRAAEAIEPEALFKRGFEYSSGICEADEWKAGTGAMPWRVMIDAALQDPDLGKEIAEELQQKGLA